MFGPNEDKMTSSLLRIRFYTMLLTLVTNQEITETKKE